MFAFNVPNSLELITCIFFLFLKAVTQFEKVQSAATFWCHFNSLPTSVVCDNFCKPFGPRKNFSKKVKLKKKRQQKNLQSYQVRPNKKNNMCFG